MSACCSKEMLNTESIKQFPSKERMAHISEAWKKVNILPVTLEDSLVCVSVFVLLAHVFVFINICTVYKY